MSDLKLEWFDEKVESVPVKKFLYKIICFLSGNRKLTYRELYVLLLEINGGNRLGDNQNTIKQKCIERIVEIYYFNNNKIPNDMEKYVEFK
jgi:hypothetical protein